MESIACGKQRRLDAINIPNRGWMASPDLVQTLQNAVDGIIAAAKIRNVN
jgi:hypothetical protein